MTYLKGVNAGGHLGWATKRCTVCGRKLIVGKDIIYTCPKCRAKGKEVYFCAGDYRALHGRCPYCGSELVPLL